MPQVALPSFPDRSFSILDYGAVPGGGVKNTEAINRAVAACADAGGGRVVIPEGLWLTGPIQMRSNVNLHAEAGALVLFSREIEDYPLVRTSWEGLDTVRRLAPISGRGLENIAITGPGIFDGSGHVWRSVLRRKLTEGQWNELVASGGYSRTTGAGGRRKPPFGDPRSWRSSTPRARPSRPTRRLPSFSGRCSSALSSAGGCSSTGRPSKTPPPGTSTRSSART